MRDTQKGGARAIPALFLDGQSTSTAFEHKVLAAEAFVRRFGRDEAPNVAWAALGTDDALNDLLGRLRGTLPRAWELPAWFSSGRTPLDGLVRQLLARTEDAMLIVFTTIPLGALSSRPGIEAVSGKPWSVAAGSMATLVNPVQLLG